MVRSVDDPNKRCIICGKYLYEEAYCEKCRKFVYDGFVAEFEHKHKVSWDKFVSAIIRVGGDLRKED